MGHRRHQLEKCDVCGLHPQNCVCDDTQSIATTTHVHILFHALEYRKSTNTGKLVTKLLSNSSYSVRGQKDYEFDVNCVLKEGYENLVLFPYEDATVIDENWKSPKQSTLPINLIVPDGTWRQAFKMVPHESALKDLPRVKIRPQEKSKHVLRRNIEPNNVSTLEAILIALSHLEGERGVEVSTHIRRTLNLKVERQLRSKGMWIESSASP